MESMVVGSGWCLLVMAGEKSMVVERGWCLLDMAGGIWM